MIVRELLIWSIEETAGFDSAWVWVDGAYMGAEGRSCGLAPVRYWLSYTFETSEQHVTRRMAIEARWDGGSATLDLRREGGAWTVDGTSRPDLDSALDCDLAACPLTNTMPILRHRLHREPGEQAFVMAFIEVPSLRVVASAQRYTHLRRSPDGGGIVRYNSGSFQSDLTIDRHGFVIDYPHLGRRLEASPLRDAKHVLHGAPI
ncbi:MAG: putative glycolipid-binding domain-containing protein [Candidatus Dormibacteria bacterium]